MKVTLTALLILLHTLSAEDVNVNIRFTALSVPIELVKKENINFLPSKHSKIPRVMTNEKFNQFLKGILKYKDVYTLYDYQKETVSGRTVTIKNTNNTRFPAGYKPVKGIAGEKKDVVNIVDIEPEFTDAREIGTILEATPVIEKESNLVSVELRTHLSAFYGWKVFNSSFDIKSPVLRSMNQETRIVLEKGYTTSTACLFDNSLSKSINELTDKTAPGDQCILLFVSVDGHKIKTSEKKPPLIFYSNIKLEMHEDTYSNLKIENSNILDDKEIKTLIERISRNEGIEVVSINNGITLNGSTSITHNTVSANLPGSFKRVNIKDQPVYLPEFQSVDLGSIYEFIPTLSKNGISINTESSLNRSVLIEWQNLNSNKMIPVINQKPDKTTISTNSGSLITINTDKNQHGFLLKKVSVPKGKGTTYKNERVVLTLYYSELL